MKKIIFTFLFLLASSIILHGQTNTWTAVNSFAGSIRSGAACFSIYGDGYLSSGQDNIGAYQNDLWKYDSTNGNWTQMASYPAPGRFSPMGAAYQSHGFIMMGSNNGTIYNDVWEWSQSTNTWTQGTNFPGAGRLYGIVLSCGSTSSIYFGLGMDTSGTIYSDFYRYYQPSHTWQQKTSFPGGPRSGASCFTINNRCFAGLGTDNHFWEYIPFTDNWTPISDFPGTFRKQTICFGSDSLGFIGCGILPGFEYNDFWEYDPLTDLWIQMASYPGAGRYELAGFALGNKAYIGTGHTDVTGFGYSDFWMWDGALPSKWRRLDSLPASQRRNPAGFVIGDDIYVGLGSSGFAHNGYLKDFWKWNRLSSTWTQVANFPGIGRQSAVSFAIGNNGYAGMGSDSNITRYDDFYEYNPINNFWITKNNFTGGYRDLARSWAIGNKGYLLGGTGWKYYNDLWEYDYQFDSWTQKSDFPAGPRIGCAEFTIGDRAYIFGGTDSLHNLYNDLWEWDQSTGSWTQKSSMPATGRADASGFSIGDFGYVVNGRDLHGLLKEFYQYDSGLNIWIRQMNFPGLERINSISFSAGGCGYLAAGTGFMREFSEFWQYNDSALLNTRVDEKNISDNFIIAPNPSSGKIRISGIFYEKIEILDLNGNIIFQSFKNSEIVLPENAAGILLVRIHSKNKILTKKICIIN